jgi:glycosyltransferase involved in cell wall biosynthesis
MRSPMLKIAFVTNNPPPYRIPVFARLGRMPGISFQAIFCSEREPNREWDLPPLDFNHVFLRERYIEVKGRYIHNNPDVITALKRFAPNVVVTDGFYPTQLYAFGYALAKGVAHVPLTDGTDISEQGLSSVHKLVRSFVYARSRAFLSASSGGDRLYRSYGIPAAQCFKSYLCIDNEVFYPESQEIQKNFDFIFCGRIEPVKNPLFALNVALETAKKLGRKVRILFVGSGSLEPYLKAAAALRPDLVEAEFHGFAAQRELPSLYRSARIFLFPTLFDPWGVVGNEACAAGLPVLVSSHAGIAGELVLNFANGFVCDLDANLWAQRAVSLLTKDELWQHFSSRSLSLVRTYTFENAALGFLAACRFAASVPAPREKVMPV